MVALGLLIREQRVPDAFKIASNAAKSGKENGGWLFVDLQSGDVTMHHGSDGTASAMPNEPEEFKKLVANYAKGSRKHIFILDFHTHKGSPIAVGVI